MKHVSGSTILIAGGFDGNRQCGDWFLVDVEKKSVEKVLQNDEFRFEAAENQSKLIDQNNLVVLVV